MDNRKDLFTFLALITTLVGIFWTIVAIVIFLIQSMTLENDGVIQAFWFTYNSLLYSWGLCFVPMTIIFGFLSYRNGVILRQERQHFEQIEAIQGLKQSLQFQAHKMPHQEIPAISAQSGHYAPKDESAYMPPRYVPPRSPIIIEASRNSPKHSKYQAPEPSPPPTPSPIDIKIFQPPTNKDDKQIAQAGRLWKAGRKKEAIQILESIRQNPKAQEILSRIRK